MAALQKNRTAIAALVVYVASLIGGGLHHHEHPTQDGHLHASRAIALVSDKAAESLDDDDSSCTICKAVHLAKASTPNAMVQVCSTCIYEARVGHSVQPLLPFRAISRARAPPVA